MATVLNTENGKGYNVCENNYIYSPEWLKKIKFKLAPQTISCQLFLALGKLQFMYFLIQLEDNLPGPLDIGQVRMKSNLLSRKFYLFWTTGQHVFPVLLQSLREKTQKYIISPLYRCFCFSLKPSIAFLWGHNYIPCTIASFTKIFLLKQKSIITEQHLELGKASFEFSFDTQLHSMHNFTTCFVSDLFSWYPVKI